MPILNYDFRKHKKYRNLVIKKDTFIPTTDEVAWEYFYEHRWIYNKLDLAIINDIDCGLGGIYPEKYPVIIKPIINLIGGGFGSKKINSDEELDKYCLPGYFWMEFFTGDHISYDIIIQKGKIVWIEAFKGIILSEGVFDYWERVTDKISSSTVKKFKEWISLNLVNYTGCLCVETIGGSMIEAHLRMGDLDRTMNVNLIQSVIDIYEGKDWSYYHKEPASSFFIFALFGDPEINYKFNKKTLIEAYNNLTFLQVDPINDTKANPPTAKRLLILCDTNENKCLYYRNKLIKTVYPSISIKFIRKLKK